MDIENQIEELKAQIQELVMKLHVVEVERDCCLMQLREESERRTWLESRWAARETD